MPAALPVVIQSICTSWTKASRGGINAAARNRTPEASLLPAISYSENAFLLHKIFYGEYNCFQHPGERLEQVGKKDPFWYDCFQFSFHENILHVTFEWERSKGAPRRFAFPRTEFILQDQQWIRITYNVRLSPEYGWVYEKRIFNIGFYSPSSPEIFLEGVPAHTYTDMAQLW